MLSLLCASLLVCSTLAQTVDLGYAQYSPSSSWNNVTVYNNIRYAAPPTGSNRFAPPKSPLTETTVNDGSTGYTCPYAYPQNSQTTSGYNSGDDQSEDCLFLDVYVPSRLTSDSAVPVMVWIHGGGFTSGSKDLYPGFGLVEASNYSMIYVALNYRLGAFGFSAGSAFAAAGGTANLGLLDQDFALQWVKSQISHFGGDPSRVTLAGESAGASSTMFHLAAKGGATTPAFHQALMQSPAVLPEFQSTYLDAVFRNFSSLAGCPSNSLSCLRALDTQTLMQANMQQIQANAVYGSFVYGPSVDGSYVQALPSREFATGNAVKMPMLISFTGNESAIFANSAVTTAAQFNAAVESYLPGIDASYYSSIEALYPIASYPSEFARVSQFIDDSLVGCNVRAMAVSNPSNAYVYEFDVGTAHHGSDILYTFLNSFTTTSAEFGLSDADIQVAEMLQAGITSFVISGVPGIKSYTGGTILVVSESGASTIPDPNANARCNYLIEAPYDPASARVTSAVTGSPTILTGTSDQAALNASGASSGSSTGTVAAAAVSSTSKSTASSSGTAVQVGFASLLSLVTVNALYLLM